MAHVPIFDKVLIANRGEIACRVMKTCKRLGIKTVAVYSTADEQAKHVRMADEAVCIGPPTSTQSYLSIPAVMDAVLKTKVNAVHPGYGFLSENAKFSAELKQNNVVFIGPDAPSIEAMGDKIHSKQLAKEAGVNTIPGFIGAINDHETLLKKANEVGYPVMVKAAQGGGGKGMRVANNDAQCKEFYDICREEARSAFASDRMLVEKFIETPRHIEVQIIADRCGNTIYLPERECSIQRRNQKVLEEAPSAFIDPATREQMGKQAAAMARKVNYVTAGTVEMVVDANRKFYFLEMNTRLQVEHPITELITGVDLVEQMIRAASGRPLSFKQEDVKINGWATEARVYAEDPMKNYFPSIGRLTAYTEPSGNGVRVDSGIVEGSQISVYYDPLIAKLCTWGETRDQSLNRMGNALDEFVVRGLRHNICLLRDVIDQKRYREGKLTTNYLPETYPTGFSKAELPQASEEQLHTAAALCRWAREALTTASLARTPTTTTTMTYWTTTTTHGNATSLRRVEMSVVCGNKFRVQLFKADNEDAPILDQTYDFEWPVDSYIINMQAQDADMPTTLQYWGTSDERTYSIQTHGSVFDVVVLTPAEQKVYQYMSLSNSVTSTKHVLSPMPGVVVNVNVSEGDTVVAGTELLTLEAMKMRNKIRAEVDGVVKHVRCVKGKTVEEGAVLVEFV